MARKTSPPPTGNMIIGQSGGPTVVINQSLVGAILTARRNKGAIKQTHTTTINVNS